MARTCIFCDHGSGDLSLEHVWPEWIWRLYHKKPQAGRYAVEQHMTGENPRRRKASTIDMKIRMVCKTCNNGWMSRLENDLAKPVLEPLILRGDVAATLTLDDQAMLVMWAMKMAFVFDFTTVKTATRHYEQAERVRFSKDLTPPPVTYIWIANYVGRRRTHSSITNLRLSHRENTSVQHSLQISTFAVGRVAFQVLNVRSPENASPFDERRAINPHWDRVTFRLWPSNNIDLPWPRDYYIDDAALRTFADRLGAATLGPV